jgi:hypothetical protein
MFALLAATGGATALAGVFAAWTARFRSTDSLYRTQPAADTDPA